MTTVTHSFLPFPTSASPILFSYCYLPDGAVTDLENHHVHFAQILPSLTYSPWLETVPDTYAIAALIRRANNRIQPKRAGFSQ